MEHLLPCLPEGEMQRYWNRVHLCVCLSVCITQELYIRLDHCCNPANISKTPSFYFKLVLRWAASIKLMYNKVLPELPLSSILHLSHKLKVIKLLRWHIIFQDMDFIHEGFLLAWISPSSSLQSYFHTRWSLTVAWSFSKIVCVKIFISNPRLFFMIFQYNLYVWVCAFSGTVCYLYKYNHKLWHNPPQIYYIQSV